MDQKSRYLLQILESIGAPLMGAIVSSNANTDDPMHNAQTMAALLGKTVEASIGLGDIMDINPAEAQDDTLRVALAGLAGPLVAGQYARRGAVPDANDLKKITAALQAVLTFSDNFAPSPETVTRLKNLKAEGQSVDLYQTQIQYIQAFIPVVEAIAAFSFGQKEAKLVTDVSDKLVKHAVELREALLPDINEEAVQKRCELGLLHALASLYASCHRAETEKAKTLNPEQQGSAASIENVWGAFSIRAAMMETLAGSLLPHNLDVKDQASSQSSSGGITPATIEEVETPVASAPQPPSQVQPVAQESSALPSASQTPAQPSEQKPAIFSSSPAAQQSVATPTPPPQTPPPAPPPENTLVQENSPQKPAIFSSPIKKDASSALPPSAPPLTSQTPPTPSQPPVQPPAAPLTQAQDNAQDSAGGNPMSMFAKPQAKKDAALPPSAPPTTPVAPPVEQPPPASPPPATTEAEKPPSQNTGGPMSFFKKDDED